MPVSVQNAANKKNAQKSTGPKTKAGKAKSSKNAMKHGLTSADVVTPGENAEEFDELVKDLRADWKPEGALEQQLVDRIAACSWQLCRLTRLETAVMANQQKTAHYDFEFWVHQKIEKFAAKHTDTETDGESKPGSADLELAKIVYKSTVLAPEYKVPSLGQSFINDHETMHALAVLCRYAATIERTQYRALNMLRELQAARLEKETISADVVDVTAD